jgi:hypothetical protein
LQNDNRSFGQADVFLESLSALEMSGTFATFDLNSLYSILAEKVSAAVAPWSTAASVCAEWNG